MCGIVGILAFKTSIPDGVLERATASLAHRGPDDSGTILLKQANPEMEIGLGHRRLAIIDLSPLGHQPMRDPMTGNWIIYNGEIYNFIELRRQLEDVGVEFKSHSDTEVILLAYRVWGEPCVARLRGMFAFGLWDESKKRLLLARDPMGIKPLYYYQSAKCFVFASEVRTLLSTGLVRAKRIQPGLSVISNLARSASHGRWWKVSRQFLQAIFCQ
jgi:asparagine synthase (glutamine-hydrolysing)